MTSIPDLAVLHIDAVTTIYNAKGKHAQITNRRWTGLSFCLDGQITYTHNDRTFISDPNHAVFLPQGQTYCMHTDKAGAFPLINFTCHVCPFDTILTIPIENLESYLRGFEQMKRLSVFPRNHHKVLSIFYSMLSRLCDSQSLENSILGNSIAYLENHISDPDLSNQTLADQTGFSEVYFRKLFQKQYGISPRQYIVEARLQKAKHMLSNDILSVSAVAEECGFSSVYHFSRTFKERLSMTPSEYAKRNRISKL